MSFVSQAAACGAVIVLLGVCAAAGAQPASPHPDGAAAVRHPFLLFDEGQTQELAKRKASDPLLKDCWDRLAKRAAGADSEDDWAEQLEARALLWQLTGDGALADRAIAQMQAALARIDPVAFYEKSHFQSHARPLRAFAFAWDWLHGRMTPQQRKAIKPKLEAWCKAAYDFTEKQWWREASYNCGSIPVGGIGILAVALRGDSDSPVVDLCYKEAARRIGQNFFPLSWKPSGICWEGPNYAIVGLRYVAPYAEALRRSGGPDLMGPSGAVRAMNYLMHQWMPAGDCAPIGDNTSYGTRTFAAEYLLGLGMARDAEGLWTWRNNLNARYLDPLITYLWYPLDLTPRSPAEAGSPTSNYFEVTANRAGYVFARSRWGDPGAAFFAFATRFEKCNHQHYDMNSFLLGAFGTLFATHRSLFPYGHENHGVDFEHNMVIVDGGGWPRQDSKSSCGDDNSTDGFLVGLALGPFADYVRGDAKWSYRDNTVINDNPAIRAERTCLFVKDGPLPYLLAFDDIQYRDEDRRYDWQWYAPDAEIAGKGTVAEPLVIPAEGGRCAIRFLQPARPETTVEAVSEGSSRRRRSSLQRISVRQVGKRVRFTALAALEARGSAAAVVTPLAVDCSSASAAGATVRLPDGSVDCLAWQSEEDRVQAGAPLKAGAMETDGLTAMVRVKGGKVVGFVLGEGTYLRWDGRVLVRAASSVCVSAGPAGVETAGRQRTREGLPPLAPNIIELADPGKGGLPAGTN